MEIISGSILLIYTIYLYYLSILSIFGYIYYISTIFYIPLLSISTICISMQSIHTIYLSKLKLRKLQSRVLDCSIDLYRLRSVSSESGALLLSFYCNCIALKCSMCISQFIKHGTKWLNLNLILITSILLLIILWKVHPSFLEKETDRKNRERDTDRKRSKDWQGDTERKG